MARKKGLLSASLEAPTTEATEFEAMARSWVPSSLQNGENVEQDFALDQEETSPGGTADQGIEQENEEEGEGAPSSLQICGLTCCSVSTLGSVANLCSATLGVGILALPYGIYQSGLVGGAVLMLYSALATILSIDLLVEATNTYGSSTYEDLVQRGLGKTVRTITEISILVYCEGSCIAYIVAVGDILGPLVGSKNQSLSMIIAFCVTMLPLSLLKTMESLQWASSIGVMSIGMLVVAVVSHALFENHTSASSLDTLLWPADGMLSLLVSCPIVLVAFSNQVNVCAIYDELQWKPSMKWVTRGVVGICTVLYSVIAVLGLYDFAGNIQQNILENYTHPNLLIKIAMCSVALAVTIAFPLNVFPARVTIVGLWDANRNSASRETTDLNEPLLAAEGAEGEQQDQHSFGRLESISLPSARPPTASPDRQRFETYRHYFLSIVIAVSSAALSLVVPDIAVIFGLLGGSVSSFLGFVLPGALGIKIGKLWSGWFLVISGSIIGVVTTTATIYTTVTSDPHATNTTNSTLSI